MGKIATEIKDVSDRTLRRDMTRLEELKLIKRKGSTRDSLYYRA
jgi:DeoR/GlpR family transcriptional regulator of sugar metabolism